MHDHLIRRVHPVRRTVAAAVGLALAASLIAGCGSSGSDDASSGGGTTTTAHGSGGGGGGGATTTADEATTTADATTTTADASGGDLVGAWTADASVIMNANMANLGGSASISCSGPITLTFTDDGTMTQQGTAQCTIAGQSASATFDNRATYTTSGSTVTLDGQESHSSITIGSISRPTSAGLGSNSAEYSIDGDTLTLTFTIDPAGTVTQTYQRS